MTTPQQDRRLAAWLSSPNVAAAEIVANLGYGAVVLDIEHGSFDLADLDRFIPLLRGLRLDVLAKVHGPERAPIQQALDFGATAVVIPHIESAGHARAVCAFGKLPPLGDRSFAGGRTAAYGGFDDAWISEQDTTTRVYPMIEDAGALEEIDGILALPTVDGVFVGPSDLSLRRRRGAYARTAEDFADLARVADAAAAADKPWVMPAWSDDEKRFGLDHGADQLVLTMEHGALMSGFRTALTQTRSMLTAHLTNDPGTGEK
ncbi:aldolase/citrate lyase family protein [Micromonospora sp. B11E3]|uniref:HpcH/HpaI aldolase family protein n=1 Tax=Micromonospora sp. B11E3 TaxID=3153562 RepID=UPI00325D121A